MLVQDAMTRSLATVGPAHTLREAAAKMAIRNLGAAVVLDPDAAGPGVVTEHDILVSLARGQDPDEERVVDHVGSHILYASPAWSLELAAVVMVDRGWRHLVVCEAGDLIGVISMRDLVRCWTQEGASCDLPRLPVELEPAQSKPGTRAEIDPAKLHDTETVLSSVLAF